MKEVIGALVTLGLMYLIIYKVLKPIFELKIKRKEPE